MKPFSSSRLLPALCLAALVPLAACGKPGLAEPAPDAIKPIVVTEPVQFDTDDPAIWINPSDKTKSLVVGTDKHSDGALYVFDLDGKIVQRVGGLARPNNVDIAYGLSLGGKPSDIAVVTEREKNRLRVFRLPDMTCVDRGDLVVFGGDTTRAPMGVALYKRPRDGAIFARCAYRSKFGPDSMPSRAMSVHSRCFKPAAS